jgi:hypothetical protein
MLAVIQDSKTMLRCTRQCSHVALYTKMLHLGLTLYVPWHTVSHGNTTAFIRFFPPV